MTTTLWRLRRRVARRGLRAVEGDPRDVTEIATETQAEDADAEGEAEVAAEGLAAGAVADDIVESGGEDAFDDEDENIR